MKHYTVYRTTNTVNGHFYVGMHVTSKPDDWYIGSGKVLRQAVLKYGREAFRKEVLFVYDNENDMRMKEAEIVTEEFVARPDTYNLNTGGLGGWFHANTKNDHKAMLGKRHSEGTLRRMREYVWVHRDGEDPRKIRETELEQALLQGWNKGRDPRACAAMADTWSRRPCPHQGKVWIKHHEQQSRLVSGEDVESWLSLGWSRGR